MILYLHGEDSDDQLLSMENIYAREYEHCDMCQIFKSEIQHYRMVTKIVVDSAAVDMKTWEAAAELLYAMKPVPVLLLTHDSVIPGIYQRHTYYEVLNVNQDNQYEFILKWLNDDMDIEPVIVSLDNKKQVIDRKYYYLLGTMAVIMLLLLIVNGILVYNICNIPDITTVYVEPVKHMDIRSTLKVRDMINQSIEDAAMEQEATTEVVTEAVTEAVTEENEPGETSTEEAATTETGTTESTTEATTEATTAAEVQ
jgi:hypothetical protein